MTTLRKTFLGASVVLGVLTSRAELTWDQTVIEQTAAYGESKVEIPFTFKNTGAHPVTVLKVDTDCSCTTADLEKKVYQPGDTGGIVAVFTLGDRKGLQEKQVLVTTTDDPAKPVVLTLKVKIPAVASLGENKLIWKRGGPLDEKSTNISVQPGAVVTLEPLTAAQAEVFSAEVQPDPSTGGYTMKVRPLSTAKAVLFPIRIKVVPPVSAAIGMGNFGGRHSPIRQSSILVILRIN